MASTPRSGSTLLSRALWATGRAGAPKEYFNPQHMEDFLERWGALDPRAYVARLLRHRTSPNGVFGAKVHHHQLAAFFLANGLHPADLLPDLRWVFITRRDRLRQGISYYKALTSGQWSLGASEARRRVPYDREGIRRHVARIAAEEDQWRRWFGREGVVPCEVVYEDLAADHEGTVRRVLAALGVDEAGLAVAPPALRVMRDDETEAWVDRYRAEEGER